VLVVNLVVITVDVVTDGEIAAVVVAVVVVVAVAVVDRVDLAQDARTNDATMRTVKTTQIAPLFIETSLFVYKPLN
jgi:hypothetical protein